jgi:outer membrane protein assembly factor BamB
MLPFRAVYGRKGRGHNCMTRRGLLLLLPLLLLLTACGTGRFVAQGWSGLTLVDNLLYVGSGEGKVVVLNVDDGDVVWSYPDRNEDSSLGSIYSAPTISEDAVYVAATITEGGRGFFSSIDKVVNLYSIEKDGGSLRWPFPTPGLRPHDGPLAGQPVVVAGKVLIGSSDGNLYALDEEEGEQLWVFPTEGRIWSTPAVEGDTVYVASLDHKLYAVSLESGEERWRFDAGGAITGTPVVADGRVYFGSFDRSFFALDSRNGSEVWRQQMDGWVWGGAVLKGRTLFVGTLGGTVYGLGSATGEVLWSTLLRGPVLIPPAVLGERLVVVTDERTMHVLDQDNGREMRQFCSLDYKVRTPMVASSEFVYMVDEARSVLETDTRRCPPTALFQDTDE